MGVSFNNNISLIASLVNAKLVMYLNIGFKKLYPISRPIINKNPTVSANLVRLISESVVSEAAIKFVWF